VSAERRRYLPCLAAPEQLVCERVMGDCFPDDRRQLLAAGQQCARYRCSDERLGTAFLLAAPSTLALSAAISAKPALLVGMLAERELFGYFP